MNISSQTTIRKRRGFFASLGLAWRIFTGALRLLRRHPKLLLPLLPVFIIAFVITYDINNLAVISLPVLLLLLGAIFVTAYALMFSFAISSQMLKQIHEGREVSITGAIGSPETARMIPRVLGLSVMWYGLVLVLVTIEMIISAALDRISEGLGQKVVRAIFGTLADAMRMSAFMMVAVMVFEDTGVRTAYGRLKEIARNNAIVALGGLTLTSTTTSLIVMFLYALGSILGGTTLGAQATALLFPIMAVGWLLSMYLEQMFITSLYVYETAPRSPLVDILLGDFTGKELPQPVGRLG